MGTYEVGVFITQDAFDYAEQQYGNGWRPQERAKTFFSGAFDQSEHSVTYIDTNHVPNAPYEKISDSFTAPCICDPLYACSFNNLFDWWRSECKADCTDFQTAQDTNVLITMADGGGLGGGRFAVTAQADEICKLPSSYETYGYGSEYHAMWVAMQEAGHSLINSTDDDGDGAVAHDMATVFSNAWYEQKTITPTGVNGSTNECGTSVDKSNTSQTHMFWSECAESRFK